MSKSSVQLNLPPGLLPNPSREPAPRTICSQEPEAVAAALFDEALDAAAISSKEVSALVDVSESLVNRWRSANYRETPSFVQLLRLPPVFHLELHRAMNRRFGFGRAALLRLLEAAGDLAAVVPL